MSNYSHESAFPGERGSQRPQLKGGAHSRSYGRQLQAEGFVAPAPGGSATHVNSYSDEGIFFLPEGEDPIGLYNLQMNTQGYYTSFHLSYVNGDDIHRTACELLLAIVPQLEMQWLEDDLPLTVELNAILNEPAITHLLAMSGSVSGSGSCDTKGNTKLSGSGQITSNDGKKSGGVTATGARDSKGKVSGSIEGSFTYEF